MLTNFPRWFLSKALPAASDLSTPVTSKPAEAKPVANPPIPQKRSRTFIVR